MRSWTSPALSGILLMFFVAPLWGQSAFPCLELKPNAAERLEKDIAFLASDELGGRAPGSKGVEAAARYLENEFREIGVEPIYPEGYRQKFTINSGVSYASEKNSLIYDEEEYEVGKDYFPLSSSSDGTASGKTIYIKYGIDAPEKEYNDYEDIRSKKLNGRIFVIDVSSPDGIHPHSEYAAHHSLGARVRLAMKKGAAGVVFVNTSGTASDPNPHYRDLKPEGIPVVFVQNKELAEELVNDNDEISITTSLVQETVDAFNVVSVVDNGSLVTVVIGAHYDHLGMGTSSSLYRGKGPRIHNGADDNASGTAGLLELARNVIANRENFQKYNYVFAAFSGEELGLLGSSYFVKHGPIKDARVAYMFNMDMIGRVEDEQLAINGVGTSSIWKKLIGDSACGKLKIQTSESGVGPSDHTSFYYLDVPVLHFFSGTHEDYHKPSDDFEKINIQGEMDILQYMFSLMHELEKIPSIDFTPTKTEMSDTPRFTVTLGVLPDYMYSGKGMKIDGITEGKTAAKAGLQAGDIVVKLGDYAVDDMMSYMKALGSFKAGDKTRVEYLRNGERKSAAVQF